MKAFTLSTPRTSINNITGLTLEQVAALGFAFDGESPEQTETNLNNCGVFIETISANDDTGTMALKLIISIMTGQQGEQVQAVMQAAMDKFAGATTPAELRDALAAQLS